MNNIISIVVILTSIAVFFGFIDPQYAQIKTLLAEKTEYDNAIKRSSELQGIKQKLLEEVEKIDGDNKDLLFKLLPDNIDNIRLINDIDETAKTYGMSIRNFKTETSEQRDSIGRDNNLYGTMTLAFSTSAPYSQFLSFIADLERSLRILDISSIDFAVTNDTNPVYDYDVKLKTYWLK